MSQHTWPGASAPVLWYRTGPDLVEIQPSSTRYHTEFGQSKSNGIGVGRDQLGPAPRHRGVETL